MKPELENIQKLSPKKGFHLSGECPVCHQHISVKFTSDKASNEALQKAFRAHVNKEHPHTGTA